MTTKISGYQDLSNWRTCNVSLRIVPAQINYHEPTRQVPIEAQRKALARAIYKARRMRMAILPEDVGGPGWDILIDLFLNGASIIKQACIAADIPATTALRYIAYLEQQFLIARKPDPNDSRKVWINLTKLGRQKVEAALDAKRTLLEAALLGPDCA